jgi:hypothetical protein
VIDSTVQVPVIPAGEPADISQVSTDGGKDKAILRQTLTIPGYWVKDTTAGFYIPARWVLVQPSPGTYAWWLAPPEFRRR